MTHIKFTKTHDRRIIREKCLDCGRNSFFACFHEEWYGWDVTCLRCGRRWCDGEWMPFDFARGVREHSIRSAKRRWKRGLDEGEIK